MFGSKKVIEAQGSGARIFGNVSGRLAVTWELSEYCLEVLLAAHRILTLWLREPDGLHFFFGVAANLLIIGNVAGRGA